MKPVIGITADIENESKHVLGNNNVEAIIRAGGLPVIIPTGIDKEVQQLCKMLDGLLLTGGGDIDPMLFGEEPHKHLGDVSPSRDLIEMALVKEMLKLNKPVLGICRGLQIINIALGGNMYQDIYSQRDVPLLQHAQKAHRYHQSHLVQVEKGSLLESITKSEQIKVNSYHHQAVKDVPLPLIVSGVASDGTIEAIESTKHAFVLGVQWHPEALADNKETVSLDIFEKFLEKSRESRAL